MNISSIQTPDMVFQSSSHQKNMRQSANKSNYSSGRPRTPQKHSISRQTSRQFQNTNQPSFNAANRIPSMRISELDFVGNMAPLQNKQSIINLGKSSNFDQSAKKDISFGNVKVQSNKYDFAAGSKSSDLKNFKLNLKSSHLSSKFHGSTNFKRQISADMIKNKPSLKRNLSGANFSKNIMGDSSRVSGSTSSNRFPFNIVKMPTIKENREKEANQQYVFSQRVSNPILPNCSSANGSGYRSNMNGYGSSQGVRKSSQLYSMSSSILKGFIKEDLTQKFYNLVIGISLLNAILYLFFFKYGLFTTILLIGIETAILALYYSNFTTYDKYSLDMISLFNSGFKNLGSYMLVVMLTVLLLTFSETSLLSNSTANISLKWINLLLSFNVAYTLLFDKLFNQPENTKKTSIVQILTKFSLKFLKFRIAQDLIKFTGIIVIFLLVEGFRTSQDSQNGNNGKYDSWSFEEQTPLTTQAGLNSVNLIFLIGVFIRVFAFLKFKLYMFKVLLCSEINFSQLFYSRESACFSFSNYNDKTGRAFNLGGLIEFQAFNNLNNTSYLKSCLVRNSGDVNNTVCYWTQLMMYLNRNLTQISKNINSGIKGHISETEKYNKMDFVEQMQEIFSCLLGKTKFRRFLPGVCHGLNKVSRVSQATYELLNFSKSNPNSGILLRNPLFSQFVNNLDELIKKTDKLIAYVESNEEDFMYLDSSLAQLVRTDIWMINKKFKHVRKLLQNQF